MLSQPTSDHPSSKSRPKFKNQVRKFCEEDASDCNGVLEISKAYWSLEELTFWCFCHQLISLDCYHQNVLTKL